MGTTIHPSLKSVIDASVEAASEKRSASVETPDPAFETAKRDAKPFMPDASRDELRQFILTGEGRTSAMGNTSAFLVEDQPFAELIDVAYNESPIYANARVFQLERGKSPILDLPIKTANTVVAWAASDESTRAEQTAAQYASIRAEAIDVFGYTSATQTLLDSSKAEEVIIRDLADSIMEEFNAKFCVGTGSNQPTGIFTNTSGDNAYTSVASGSNDVLVAAKVIEAAYKLPTKYRKNAKWFMNRTTAATLAQNPRGATLVTHPLMEIMPDGSMSILGFPVVMVDDAPDIGDGKYPVAFGDLSRAYAVVQHREFGVLRDPFTDPGRVKFYGLTRIGGVPWDKNALILCKSDT
jgi:HK97 family phage major capsid protein